MTIELIKQNEIKETCDMIVRACKHSDFAKFYPQCSLEFVFEDTNFERIKERAEKGHFYVVKDDGKIIGCGGIGAYWESPTECWINTIFVEPAYQRKGIGTKIIEFLENDEYAKRASRIEIHSAIPAVAFYRRLGYEHKNGQLSYYDGMFDLEKFV
ncbi:MAG: GNAT family N-acetyltransferase [Clostridia bacterium]|nr:GNAT family N-acetyltransferase [Clostridia bacterium]